MKFKIVVSGIAVAVRCRKTKVISKVISDVLQQTGNITFSDWEMRLPDGRLLDPFDRIGDVVADGVNLFLAPRAGVGGATLTAEQIENNMDRARAELPELDAKLDAVFRLPENGMVLR